MALVTSRAAAPPTKPNTKDVWPVAEESASTRVRNKRGARHRHLEKNRERELQTKPVTISRQEKAARRFSDSAQAARTSKRPDALCN